MKKMPKKSEDSAVKKRLASLIDVKSIITLSYTFVLLAMMFIGKKIPNEMLKIYEEWIMFFIGAKSESKRVKKQEE